MSKLDLFYDETEGTEPANENKKDSRSYKNFVRHSF